MQFRRTRQRSAKGSLDQDSIVADGGQKVQKLTLVPIFSGLRRKFRSKNCREPGANRKIPPRCHGSCL
jgi:hypothetical protein